MTWAVRQIHCAVNSDAWFSTWQGTPHFHLRLELPLILSWVLLGSLLSEDGSDLKRQLFGSRAENLDGRDRGQRCFQNLGLRG